jgi:hypothetical protein
MQFLGAYDQKVAHKRLDGCMRAQLRADDRPELDRNGCLAAVLISKGTSFAPEADGFAGVDAHVHEAAVRDIEEVAVRLEFRQLFGIVELVDGALIEDEGNFAITLILD